MKDIDHDLEDLLYNGAGHWPDMGEDGEGAWLLTPTSNLKE